MIELTIREILDSIETLQLILDKPMKARLSYKVACIIEEVEKENTKYNNVRNELIKKYGKRDENNNLIEVNGQVTVPPEDIDDFNKELLELLNTQISIPLTSLDLSDIEEMELSPRQMIKIKKYIKKEEA